MNYESHSRESLDLMLVVERLSTQDQRRIVRLIELLRAAPDALRDQTQSELKSLVAREPQTHAECLESIDRIIGAAERVLENRPRVSAGVSRASRSSDVAYGYFRHSG